MELILGTGRSSSGTLLTSDYYTGQLAEFLVFNDQLSIGQINLVANYLSTEYALPFAYETNLLSAQSALVGDYNHDGVVDAADYVVWRKTGINGQQGLRRLAIELREVDPRLRPFNSGRRTCCASARTGYLDHNGNWRHSGSFERAIENAI